MSTETPLRILVTGAAGNIAYALSFLIARGGMFGDRKVILHLLDIPPMAEKLRALDMEMEDLASDIVVSTVVTTDPEAAFRDIDVALLVGARPRGPGMERKDLLEANAGIFKQMGECLAKYAKEDVKVCVVGNPANTNALITATHAAPRIPARNITALTRLDQNRAKAQLAKKIGVAVDSIKNVVIWGNHSKTQVPSALYATVSDGTTDRGVASLVGDDEWLRTEFVSTIQTRGAAVIKARGASSAASAACAICDHVRDWLLGSDGQIVSMAVFTGPNTYGVDENLMFSLPVICKPGGEYEVQELSLDDWTTAALKTTEAELLEERALALEK